MKGFGILELQNRIKQNDATLRETSQFNAYIIDLVSIRRCSHSRYVLILVGFDWGFPY